MEYSILCMMIAQSAYEIWNSKEFKLFVDFDELPQVEQDRMFNEFQVTALGIVYLISEEQKKPQIARSVKSSYLQTLMGMGIENKYIKTWEQLIDLRFAEYRDHYKILVRESQKMSEFKKKDADLRITWARLETLVIDGVSHIRRGEFQEGDKLIKLVRFWILKLQVHIAAILKEIEKENSPKN